MTTHIRIWTWCPSIWAVVPVDLETAKSWGDIFIVLDRLLNFWVEPHWNLPTMLYPWFTLLGAFYWVITFLNEVILLFLPLNLRYSSKMKWQVSSYSNKNYSEVLLSWFWWVKVYFKPNSKYSCPSVSTGHWFQNTPPTSLCGYQNAWMLMSYIKFCSICI